MSFTIERERPDTPDAVGLIMELEAALEPLYPPVSRHGFSVEKLVAQGVVFFVARVAGAPAGCGGILLVGDEYGELKRMYVRPQFRGQGLARALIVHLGDYAAAQGVGLLRLETGVHQHEAIRLYERAGFSRTGPFGPYTDDPLSLYYEKRLA